MQSAQEPCESRGGRLGLPFLVSTVSVDVKEHFNNNQKKFYIYAETTTQSHVHGQTSQSRST